MIIIEVYTDPMGVYGNRDRAVNKFFDHDLAEKMIKFRVKFDYIADPIDIDFQSEEVIISHLLLKSSRLNNNSRRPIAKISPFRLSNDIIVVPPSIFDGKKVLFPNKIWFHDTGDGIFRVSERSELIQEFTSALDSLNILKDL